MRERASRPGPGVPDLEATPALCGNGTMKPGKHIYDYPRYYEIGFAEKEPDRVIGFLLRSYMKHSSNRCPRSLLDNGCGTGLHLDKFARLGIRVTGYDSSPAMVGFARTRLREIDASARVFCADLRDFRVDEPCDMGICMNGSFQYLVSVEDILKHLACVGRSLRVNGLYFIDLPAPGAFIDHPPGRITSRWKRTAADVTVDVDWTHRQQSVDWNTQTFSGLAKIRVHDGRRHTILWKPYRYRILFAQEIRALAEWSQYFQLVELYGDYHLGRTFERTRHPTCMLAVLRKKRL